MRRFSLLVVALAVSACAEKHDVAYFKAHTEIRDTKLAKCRNQPGAFDNDSECINAALADDVRQVSYWKAQPAEMKRKLAECKEHAATIGQSDNCKNAAMAQNSNLGGGTFVPIR